MTTSTSMTKLSALVVLAVASATLAGCGTPAGRTGSGTDPVTLARYDTTAATDVTGPLAADAPSSVSVRTVARPADGGDEETAALDAVKANRIDLVQVRSGRLVLEGAASLAPLGAPFVVTNDDQAIAIARDDITRQLLADLPKIGLVGLAVVPVGVRYPFGYGKPLLGAEDYAGQVINSRRDAGVQAIIDALGARLDTSIDEERTAKVRAGELRGIETMLRTQGAVDRPAVIASNVRLYERFDVLAVRSGAWKSMTEQQQAQLRAAATRARDEAFAAGEGEVKLFADFCATDGSTSAEASTADLASLHEKLDPVAAAVEAAHPDVVARMRELHTGTTDVIGLRCVGRLGDDRPAWARLAPAGPQDVLDGTWRFAAEERDLVAAGLTPDDARGNAGVWELTLSDGKGQLVQPSGKQCSSTFTFAGDRVVFFIGPEEWCGSYLAGRYALDGDTVRFTWAEAGDSYGRAIANGLFGEAVRVQQ